MRAMAEAAVDRIKSAGALDDPMFGYALAPRTFGGPNQGLNQRFELSQKMPWPGTLSAQTNVARREADAAGYDVDALQLQVATGAEVAYADWYLVDRAIAINRASQGLLEDLRATAEGRYAAGLALQQDVLQAEVEHARLQRDALDLARRKRATLARINGLLNRASDTAIPSATDIAVLQTIPDDPTLLALALARYPEIARLDARLGADVGRVQLARKSFYPNFQLSAGYNSLWDEVDKRTVVGVSINVPLDRGKRRAELDRAEAQRDAAQWALVERRARLTADVAQARADVEESIAQLRLHHDQLSPLANDYFQAALADYRSGGGAFLNVIAAEREQLNVQLDEARIRADYIRRLALLKQWTGGQFATTPTPTAQDGDQP